MSAELALIAGTLPPAVLLVWGRLHSGTRMAWTTIWTSFLLGAVSVIPVVVLVHMLGGVAPLDSASPWYHAVEALRISAVPEECVKFSMLLFFATGRRGFKGPRDGIVHGLAVAVGFAAVENALFAARGGIAVAAMRTVTSLPLHATLGVIMGYYVGAAVRGGVPQKRVVLALALPVGLHAAYNAPLYAMGAMAQSPIAVTVLWAAFASALVIGLRVSIVFLRRTRRRVPLA